MLRNLVLTGLLLAAACAAQDIPAGAEQEAAMASFEDREKAMSDATRTGANTYAQSCAAIAERFAAEPWRPDLAARISSPEPAIIDHVTLPSPRYPAGATSVSAVCRIVFDLDADGTPVNVAAQCSDARFEAAALEGMRTAKFRIGPDTPRKGVVYPMEFCATE